MEIVIVLMERHLGEDLGEETQWSNQRNAVSASKSVLPDKDKDEKLRK